MSAAKEALAKRAAKAAAKLAAYADAERLAARVEGVTAYLARLVLRCPVCAAAPGVPCRAPGRPQWIRAHPARVDPLRRAVRAARRAR